MQIPHIGLDEHENRALENFAVKGARQEYVAREKMRLKVWAQT